MSLEATPTEAPAAEAPVEAAVAPVEAPAEPTLVTEPEAPAEAPAEPEAKPEAEAKPEEAPGAPEEYAAFAMPEGITLDEAAATDFKAVAKELNLPQDKAQRLVDLAAQMRQRDAEAIIGVRNGWLEASRADPEFGGDKLNENLATAKRALEAYGTPALSQLLNETGIGNHPEIVRLLVKAGAAVSEDKFVGGKTPPPTANATLAHKLYGASKE